MRTAGGLARAQRAAVSAAASRPPPPPSPGKKPLPPLLSLRSSEEALPFAARRGCGTPRPPASFAAALTAASALSCLNPHLFSCGSPVIGLGGVNPHPAPVSTWGINQVELVGIRNRQTVAEGEGGSPGAGPPAAGRGAGSAAPGLPGRLGTARPAVFGVLVGGAVGSLAFWFSVFFGGTELRPGFFEGVWWLLLQPYRAWGLREG